MIPPDLRNAPPLSSIIEGGLLTWSYAPTLVALLSCKDQWCPEIAGPVYLDIGAGASTLIGAELSAVVEMFDTSTVWRDKHAVLLERGVGSVRPWGEIATRQRIGRFVALVDHQAATSQRIELADHLLRVADHGSRVIVHDCNSDELRRHRRGERIMIGQAGALVVLGPNLDAQHVRIDAEHIAVADALIRAYAEWRRVSGVGL